MSRKKADRQAQLSEVRVSGSKLNPHTFKPETRPYLWAFTTYFAEGLPYTIIRTVSSFFFVPRE